MSGMLRRSGTLITLLLLVLAAVLQGQAEPLRWKSDIVAGLDAKTAQDFRRMDLGDFDLYFHAVDQGYANHVAGVVSASQQRLQDELDLRNFRGSQIVVAWDPPHFYRLAGSGTPHWAGAVANSEKSRIVLKSPRWGDASQDAGATIRHEMAHLGIARLRRDKWIPVWLEEGLAVHFSGLPMGLSPNGGTISLSKAISTGTLLGLSDLENLHGYGSQQADLAYMEAESAVRFFLERYGRVAMVHLLTLTGRGTGFHEAFDTATGGGYYRFEMEWKDWLEAQSGAYFLVDFSSWVWGGIILLGVFAWWVRRQRARKILRGWQKEDEEHEEEDPLD